MTIEERIKEFSPKKAALFRLLSNKRKANVAAPPLVRVDRGGLLPLSFAQERQWLMQQLGQVDIASAAVRLRGALDVGALERSFAAVVERHEVLRTRFAVIEGAPVQMIDPPSLFVLQVEDLSELAEGERGSASRERMHALTQQSFDLERGPLFRAHLLRLSGDEHVAVVVMHHIVSDGWSMGVLIREVGALYAAYVQNKPSPLSALAVQYADYALWQRDWLRDEVLERQIGYWKDRLAGAPATIELPTDRLRPAVRSYRGAGFHIELPVELTASLNELARSEGATLFMVLLAAFNVVLSRWSGQRDIVVGSPIAGRTHRELEGLIGFFVNALALRTDLSGNPGFRELLQRVKEVALGAYAHQDLPFEKLLVELQPVRDPSRQPIFQTLFALQNVPVETLELPGLRLSRLGGEVVTAKFDLSLYMQEREGKLEGHFEYATDLFDASTIERLSDHLRMLLEGVVANPAGRIGELPLLSDAERHRVVVEWNATERDYPWDQCIHELFEAQAAKTPAAIAVVYEDSELTYGELDRRSNQLAHHLRGIGVGPEVVVGLCVERSLEMVVGLLGILKAGGAYVPLDPGYPTDRLAHMMADARASVVVTQDGLLGQLPVHGARVVRLDADWLEIATQPTTALFNRTVPENLAYVIYTSGSTGQPKGVMIAHRGLVNYFGFLRTNYHLSQSDVVLNVTSISFDPSVRDIFGPLLVGARLIVVRTETAQDPYALRSRIAETSTTVVASIIPSFLDEISDSPSEHPERTAYLRLLMPCGEPLSSHQVQRAWSSFGSNVFITNQYGPTETTMTVTYCVVNLCALKGQSVPIGRPISNMTVYVLDAAGEVVPIGVSGELYIGGVGLARGYRGRPDLTAERFVPSPFGDGERLYRTGDFVRWRADRELEYLGRIDHQVKLRGFRIELGEIEASLRGLGDVKDAVVVVREDAAGDKRLVAYVVVADAAVADAGKLRAHLEQSLPEYMVPSAFVMLQALPLTPNGKVDRRALPVPEGDAMVRGEFAAPRTPTEAVLASIWSEVLKLDCVGVYDNFFELGGHSLLAMQAVARIRDAFQIELPLRALFEAPMIDQAALLVEDLLIQELEIM